jgi:hypothetical protein
MISYIVEEVREGVYRTDYPGPEHTKGPCGCTPVILNNSMGSNTSNDRTFLIKSTVLILF